MHNVIWPMEHTFDAACFNEQDIMEYTGSSERTSQAADQVLTIEMAIEWAHLGGD